MLFQLIVTVLKLVFEFHISNSKTISSSVLLQLCTLKVLAKRSRYSEQSMPNMGQTQTLCDPNITHVVPDKA